MKDKEIIINLALTRGAMAKEKRQIILKYFPEASASFLRLTTLVIHILLLVYIMPNLSTFRIYEHANLNTSIVLRILVKFNLLICDKSASKHKYNITPLTRLIISDLIQAYKHNLNTFHLLNKADKKANYNQIKAKIKTLKEK